MYLAAGTVWAIHWRMYSSTKEQAEKAGLRERCVRWARDTEEQKI
jgi:hypothetical protein